MTRYSHSSVKYTTQPQTPFQYTKSDLLYYVHTKYYADVPFASSLSPCVYGIRVRTHANSLPFFCHIGKRSCT